jgi:hypothetical protein
VNSFGLATGRNRRGDLGDNLDRVVVLRDRTRIALCRGLRGCSIGAARHGRVVCG